MVRSPNLVLTPLKNASKIQISSFVNPSKIFVTLMVPLQFTFSGVSFPKYCFCCYIYGSYLHFHATFDRCLRDTWQWCMWNACHINECFDSPHHLHLVSLSDTSSCTVTRWCSASWTSLWTVDTHLKSSWCSPNEDFGRPNKPLQRLDHNSPNCTFHL